MPCEGGSWAPARFLPCIHQGTQTVKDGGRPESGPDWSAGGGGAGEEEDALDRHTTQQS